VENDLEVASFWSDVVVEDEFIEWTFKYDKYDSKAYLYDVCGKHEKFS
jgi:hypothetical protein